nr:ribonuclease H-like domain-containing protein [Tanacetum cinerariifolium]
IWRSIDCEVLPSVFDSRSSDCDDNPTNDRFKKDDGYHAVPPPLTGNYMPPLADLSFVGLNDSIYRPTANKASASIPKDEPSVIKTSNISVEMPNVDSVKTYGVIIKDWVSDDKELKVLCSLIKLVLLKDCDFHEKRMSKKSVLNDMGKGNKALLTDYQDIDGGFVAFVGSTKGELKFNLFYVLQMCDKKNSVLFTESECLILSPDFKLIDESQVLLRVPRQNSMYSFDLKNVVPSGDSTCLFAKAIIDESNLCHRRLGYWQD